MIDINVLKNNIYDVIGAIYEVHSELGPGLNESCYQELIKVHRAQLFNYMRLLNIHCGILVNFLPPTIDYERYFYDEETKQILGVDGQVVYYYKR